MLSVLARLPRLDDHMVTYGHEALILASISLTWITTAKLDNIP
jgi:hypothetical protein